jgi:hypothetical protein
LILFGCLSQFAQRFCVLCGVKDFVEDLLQICLVAEWPQRLVLVAEHHVFEHGVRDTKKHRYLAVHLSAVLVDRNFFATVILRFQHLLKLLKLLLLLLVQQLEGSQCKDFLPFGSAKLEFDCAFCLWHI